MRTGRRSSHGHSNRAYVASGRLGCSREGVKLMDGYCVKCRAKVEIKDAKEVTLDNGKPAAKGVCPDCGTKITKFLPMKK